MGNWDEKTFAKTCGTVTKERGENWSIGNLSNDDGDNNENGKNAIGLDWPNNNFARASRFFVHFLAFVARLRRESTQFDVLSRAGTYDNNCLFLFLNVDTVL